MAMALTTARLPLTLIEVAARDRTGRSRAKQLLDARNFYPALT
ncbi:MAG TPA: hypothetical protein VMA95_12885 [Streptosporangiaceae bacterium]|nr:hypothetical protein [Streptosporangiaceae bacterium]